MAFDRSYYVVSSQGRALFGSSSDDQVRCLDAATGRELWSFHAEGPVRFAPTVSGANVLFGSDDGRVYCVALASGAPVWRFDAAASSSSTRRLPGNGRMISDLPIRTDVLLNGSSASFGAGFLVETMGSPVPHRITVSADNGSVSSDRTTGGFAGSSPQGHTVLLTDGSVQWPTGLGGRPYDADPTKHFEWDGAAITVGSQNFTGAAGSVSAGGWSAAVKGNAYSLTFADGRLFVSTDSGYIYCFSQSAPASVDTVRPASAAMRYAGSSMQSEYADAAQTILSTSSVTRGYCLVLGSNGGHLAYELARRSKLTIVCMEPDSATAEQSRRALDSAGVYGQVCVQRFSGTTLPYTDAAFNIVTFDGYGAGETYGGSRTEVLRVLRPYGGIAFLGPGSGDLVTRGTVAGAGEWTQFYANPQNTANSNDSLVGHDLVLQWYGYPGPNRQNDRGRLTTPPLWKDGVLIVPGCNWVSAVDAYNGAFLWEDTIPRSARQSGLRDAGQLTAVQSDFVYLAAADTCYGITLRQGVKQLRFPVPAFGNGVRYHWAYVAAIGDMLFGSVEDTTVLRGYLEATSAWSVSEYMFAMNRFTGAETWRYQPAGVVVNATIAIDNGRMFFVESTNPALRGQIMDRFGTNNLFSNGKANLVALDVSNGAVLWRDTVDLGHLAADDAGSIALVCAAGRIMVSGYGDSTSYWFWAFNQSNGSAAWATKWSYPGAVDHGFNSGHPVITGSAAYLKANGYVAALDLTSGAQVPCSYNYPGASGTCGTFSGSASALYCRHSGGGHEWGGAHCWDIAQAQNYVVSGDLRPGCYINMVAAGGMLTIPEYSSGCTCGRNVQTSMALRTALPWNTNPTAARSTRTRSEPLAPPQIFLMRGRGALIITASGVPAGAKMKVRVTNLAGREVYAGRAASQGEPHSHTFVWANSGAAAGTYVVAVDAGRERANQSFTLVR